MVQQLSKWCVETRSVEEELSLLISTEGRALLRQHNLLRPLVEKMVMKAAIADIDVSEEEMKVARLDLLQKRGFESLEQWPQLLERVSESELDLEGQLMFLVQSQSFMRERFAAKAEAHFLKRKNELDQVVYSLLRLDNRFLARELYLQIDSNESNFADLAKRYAEGPERNTNGIIGPVSLTQAHPTLAEKLRVAQPGVLLEPFKLSKWWLVVRLESYSPATFTDEVADQMCREMFKTWISEETTSTLDRLADESSDIRVS